MVVKNNVRKEAEARALEATQRAEQATREARESGEARAAVEARVRRAALCTIWHYSPSTLPLRLLPEFVGQVLPS